ncbi:protein of unknown function [Tenacibaculum sp. MAR_2009_124]|uniref:eCIS core domain-containing protein n=1 Tax=Tenacibaculum sp. MAR_2009_124 TaxID=1250059 RepID=UPI0008954AC2|nr:DUF4157 domain-containing protein [Tenacibaculum sp. MAR_2009_124]SEC21075.1 protein of unknown function [Tenacibaculum sp. MAR_2009_124]
MFLRDKKTTGPNTTKNKKTSFIQPKLKTGKAGDKYEVEADKMADKVVNKTKSESTVLKKEVEEEVQQKPLASEVSTWVQKKEMAEEESVQMMEEEEGVQKQEEEEVQAKKGVKTNTNNSIEGKLRRGSGGVKMDPKTRNEMEAGFGADFSNVNIHKDSEAQEMSSNVGAQAFTHGHDIYFNEGKYDPNTKEGKHLLAHELTHTIQQKGMVQKKIQRTPLRFVTNEIGSNSMSNSSYIEFDPDAIAWVNGSQFYKVNHSDNLDITLEKNQSGVLQIRMPIHVFYDVDDGPFSEDTILGSDRNYHFNVLSNWNYTTDSLCNLTSLEQVGQPSILGSPRLEANLAFVPSKTGDSISLTVQMSRPSQGSSAGISQGGFSVGSSSTLSGSVFFQHSFTFRISVVDLYLPGLNVND